MRAHVVTIETRKHSQSVDGASCITIALRWLCTCGSLGPWQCRARSARNGGARHVAAMEKR